MEQLMTEDKAALKELIKSIVKEALSSNGHIKQENYLLLELRHQRELMDRGFTEMSRRFEEMKADTDRRFEEMKQNTDKRFEEMKQNTDKRFEDMNKRLSGLTWLIGTSFGFLALLMSLFKFLG